MLKNWGAAALCAVALCAGTGTALAQPSSTAGLPGTVGADVRLKLERDGRLTVTEVVTVPDGRTATRVVPLRVPVGDNRDRVFQVGDVAVEGKGTAAASADELTIALQAGTSTVKYAVVGAVAKIGDTLELRWQPAGGWDTALDSVKVSVITPDAPKSVSCLAGEPGTSKPCTSAELGDGRGVRATEIGLGAGERIDVAVGLQEGAAPANALVEERSGLAAAFALTPVTGAGLGGLVVLLLGGGLLLWYLRGRDARALAGDVGPVNVLVTDGSGRMAFASPDGVLPGQVGTVVDEHVDVVDVTATIVDLAVRNYVWIEEVDGHDWRFVRRNPADPSLSGYERAVYDALLPDGVDAVLLSELRGRRIDLTRVRDELYADVVAKNWFARRPDAERNLWWWAGVALGGVGVVLTVVLALVGAAALFGLVVVVAGVALAVGARSMPARTKRGSALLEHVRGLRGYLHTATPEDIPDSDREMVFSRSLPYAVVLGEAERWLATFAGTRPGLYWFGEAEEGGDLRRFAQRFPAFLGALDGVLAQAGHLRSLRG
ncbi:hypothetical protein ALI22I_25245 [Saccharothrix sp. ALI-22-I]|uniref:DUF2207 domain-containing protein n=1 Tax=Saccharothrix sp. ALI-22-I TaxID=1933778 RepID=UPI00097BCFE3|nr:DUF2207 domain-containing protein [Saccharothrix sp. ALI-22-I]ONI86051.1 hypothetical protein ALI22I_25245 [Saccharothrix sp. ALI-22-I]